MSFSLFLKKILIFLLTGDLLDIDDECILCYRNTSVERDSHNAILPPLMPQRMRRFHGTMGQRTSGHSSV